MVAGRDGRNWKNLVDIVRARREPCCRCGQPIDYTIKTRPDGQKGRANKHGFSVDHYPYPLSTHPHLAEDINNLRAAHFICNSMAGNRNSFTKQTTTSEEW